jgi:predicted transcriptional regulator
MSKNPENLYLSSQRSQLETVIDLVYFLVKEDRPLGITKLMYKTNLNHEKTKEFLEICEKKGFAYHYKIGKRERYEFTDHGKEFIYTWSDYVNRFGLKKILKSSYFESLKEDEKSRLKEIMKYPLSKIPRYKKSGNKEAGKNKRTLIMIYRDFLMHLKSHQQSRKPPKYSYQADILYNVNINSEIFKILRDLAFENKHIEIRDNKTSVKWISRIIKKGQFETFPKTNRIRKNPLKVGRLPDELIFITPEGISCLSAFDQIMMFYNLTELVYTFKPKI